MMNEREESMTMSFEQAFSDTEAAANATLKSATELA